LGIYNETIKNKGDIDMDINSLMSTILSGDSIANMSQLVGSSQTEVESVLNSVLPSLLNGAQGQAENESTAAGFEGALQDHAKADTSDLASFISNVDLADGGKIVAHLLGGEQEETTQRAAERAGLDIGKTGLILAAAAPLLMSLLGKQNAQAQNDQASSGIGGLFGKLNLGSLLGGLFGGKN